MTYGDDIENQANRDRNETHDSSSSSTLRDEQTPLLGDHRSDDQHRDAATDEDESTVVRQASWYAWRAFWAVCAAVVIGLFIKGWIDAGADVDVRATQLTFTFSSYSKLTTASGSLSLTLERRSNGP